MTVDKIYIANQIKNITLNETTQDMLKLINIGKNASNVSSRSKIGNNVVDYFTFVERLETKGKYNTNFYEFVEHFDKFKNKKYIQTMLNYYDTVKNKKKTKNHYTVLKEIYNICISAINIMRPLNCMEIFTKYNSKHILNFCAGWGGSAVAAAALNIPTFYGVEINTNLKTAYDNMIPFLQKFSQTKFQLIFDDALNIDYSKLYYDTVFTSPPYYFIEKYSHNVKYASKKEMNELFYKPIFSKTYEHLQIGGYFIINVCKEVFENVLIPLLGTPFEFFPLKKSKRQNNYTELVYVWIKN